MENITTTVELKNAIQYLEIEQATQGRLLKEQFHLTYKSLMPFNLFKSSLHEVTSSPFLIENILGTAIGLATGYFSKRMVVGASVNGMRKLLGSVLQVGVTKLVSKNPGAISSFGRFVFSRIFHKKKKKPDEQSE